MQASRFQVHVLQLQVGLPQLAQLLRVQGRRAELVHLGHVAAGEGIGYRVRAQGLGLRAELVHLGHAAAGEGARPGQGGSGG